MENNTPPLIDPKSKETIEERIKLDKQAVLEALKKAPFVFVAIKSVGRDKSSFYRWVHEDKEFAKNVAVAKKEGTINLHEKAFSVLAKFGTDGANWRASLELIKYLDRMEESKDEKTSPTLLSVLSDPKSLLVLSEVLKIASEKIATDEIKKK